jgi:anti-sigma regulatory factor (Ser/Thr protein kinase)
MRVSREFEPNPVQVQAARRFASTALHSWELDPGDVVLLLSELATNAVLHARSRFRVTMALLGARLRVEVWDASPRLPYFSVVPPDASGGRGLALVQALSGAWGIDSSLEEGAGEGKTVWFEVPLAADDRPRSASAPLRDQRARPAVRPLRHA